MKEYFVNQSDYANSSSYGVISSKQILIKYNRSI
jgi:hypothetical protein